VTSVGYFTSFDYWSTGQAEFWQALFSIASLAVVVGDMKPERRAIAGGALGGLATLFKPSPPVLLVVIICAITAARARVTLGARALASLRATALYGAGATAAVGVALIPFALSDGGLKSIYDCVIEFNRWYSREWAFDVSGLADVNWRWAALCATTFYALVFVAFGRALFEGRKGDLGTGLMSVGLLALAYAQVFAQGKLLMYHWVIAAPFSALAIIWALVELTDGIRGVMVAVMGGAMLLVTLNAHLPREYQFAYGRDVKDTLKYIRGETSRGQFYASFLGPFGNNQSTLLRIAHAIRQRSRPNDTLCVRGFMPAIYVYSGLRCPSRFPWEQHLGTIWEPPIASYPSDDIRTSWIDQHRKALAKHPPTFIVTFLPWYRDRYDLLKKGYRDIAIVDWCVVLQRDRDRLYSEHVQQTSR
jgi:hypothetical protein